ncbi:MAG: DUF1566 domain-containing protein [Campylobacteraceae bacterium]|nr:DUF1566 domain-containing protein [Campylobacteraceae bacterium]
MNHICLKTTISLLLLSNLVFSKENPTYTIVDTGQTNYYNNNSYVSKPQINDSYFGQDASYLGFQENYTNNKNGTISDNTTGLMWQKTFSNKLSWNEALNYANNSKLAGYSDWRIPTIKELYSLINFSGVTGSGSSKSSSVPNNAKPYINTSYFDFEYSPTNRYIDAQYWTQTDYVSTTMNGAKTFFGVNFADGRIKGYPKYNKGNRGSTAFYLRLVRGNKEYGKNKFRDQNDGSIYDEATQLTWMKYDSGADSFQSLRIKGALNWEKALGFCENINYAGSSNWRLPNAKELQSIVDYSKSPDRTNSAAINGLFHTTAIKNNNAQTDYPFYWTSTTHLDGRQLGDSAVYIAFGRAMGYMSDRRTNTKKLLDVHGAGAQRSDPKSGDASQFQFGRGPQGDVISINNYVRCVRDEITKINTSSNYEVKSTNTSNRPPRLNSNQNSQQNENFTRPERPNSENSNGNSGHLRMILNRFDKNADKRISYDEAPIRMKENFDRHDANSDGYLDMDELSSLPGPR